MRSLLIGFFISLNSYAGYAQWTEKDSIWLQNVLAGKDTIRLSPEFQEAIKSGSLINLGEPMGKPQMAPSTIPLAKDFSEYIQDEDDTIRRKVALKDLPPAVFWQHNPPMRQIIPVQKSILDELRRNPSVAPAGVFFDLAKMTSRKEHVHQRNAKRDATWKNYNNLPTPDVLKKRKAFANDSLKSATDSIKTDTTTNRSVSGPN